uniref:Putative mitochondrial carrier protein PET8 n=1 Tax=Lygus hesperus TaxID=30085 RepID=A0A0A9ZCZ5_LYGHE
MQFGIHSTIWYGSFAYFMQTSIPMFEQLSQKVRTLYSTVEPTSTTLAVDTDGTPTQKKWKKKETMWSGYPWMAQITSAVLSGMLSVFLTNPLDVCRTRYMVNGRTGDGSSFTKVFISLLRNEGPRSLM